jgi:hypothetical protein
MDNTRAPPDGLGLSPLEQSLIAHSDQEIGRWDDCSAERVNATMRESDRERSLVQTDDCLQFLRKSTSQTPGYFQQHLDLSLLILFDTGPTPGRAPISMTESRLHACWPTWEGALQIRVSNLQVSFAPRLCELIC